MRIVMLTQFYEPLIGGTEQHVRTLSTELVARGHDVIVVTMWHTGLPEEEISKGVRIYRLRSSMHRLPWAFGNDRRHAPPFPDPELMLQLRDIMRQERPQIVHAHNWLGRSFLPLKHWFKIPFIVTLHDYGLTCSTQGLMYQQAPCSGPGWLKCMECAAQHYGALRGIPTALSNRLIGPIEQRMVDIFLPVSQAVATGNGLVHNRFPFQVIPNFIDDEQPEQIKESGAYTTQLPEAGYLLFVGALGRLKGVETLLQAYAELEGAPPLVLIGYPTLDWSVLEHTVPQNVFVFKDWPHSAVMEAWRRCSVALIPSIWAEPFGIVALEAMSMGKPIVASRIGGLVDIIQDKQTGLLIPPGDPRALRKAIQFLLTNKEQCEKMGMNAKKRSTLFRTKTVVSQIEQVYRKALTI